MGKKGSKIPSKERNCLMSKQLCGFPDVISKLLGKYCLLHVTELSLKPETKITLKADVCILQTVSRNLKAGLVDKQHLWHHLSDVKESLDPNASSTCYDSVKSK